jgi:diguanylate cyclase (GGDEF)-like protein/PAS domain S-box-containing protein
MKDTVLALSDLFDILPDAALMVDQAGNIVFANAAVQPVLGYAPEELLNRRLDILLPPRYRATHAKQVADFQSTGHAAAMGDRSLLQALRKSGDELPVSISIANLDLNGERFSVALIRDATPVRDHLDDAISRAETDQLTGIGNRLHLSRHMQAALAQDRPFGLLFLDLSQFKPFNDRFGHQVGDAVLRMVAERLQHVVRSDDLAARIGGDEFVMVLAGLADPQLLRQRAESVAETLCRPFNVLNVRGTISVNIGGALSPRDGSTEAELLAHADNNMYRAKQSGQRYFDD